jgi:hypothetical protein
VDRGAAGAKERKEKEKDRYFKDSDGCKKSGARLEI